MFFFSVYDTHGSEENIRLLSTGAELMSLCMVTSPDALPQSYRGLVGAQASKLGSREE